MFKLLRMKIFALFLLLKMLRADILQDNFRFERIGQHAFHKRSETYSLDLIVDFQKTADFSFAEYNNLFFERVNYPIKNSLEVLPSEEEAFTFLKVEKDSLKKVLELYECQNKGIYVNKKVEFKKQNEILYANDDSTIVTYLGSYGVGLTLETMLYSSHLVGVNTFYKEDRFCLVREGSEEHKLNGGRKIKYNDIYSYILVPGVKLVDFIEYGKENQTPSIQQFKGIMNEYFSYKFELAKKGFVVSYMNPRIYIDANTYKVYSLLLDVQSFFEHIRHHDKFLNILGFPYVSYLQYTLEDGTAVSDTLKMISTFHMLFVYSYYLGLKDNNTNSYSTLASCPTWNAYAELLHTHILMHHDTNNEEECLSQFAEGLKEFIPFVKDYFPDVFDETSPTITNNSNLLLPRFSRMYLDKEKESKRLIGDKIQGAIGTSLPPAVDNHFKNRDVVLEYINYPDDIDFYQLLNNCCIKKVLTIMLLLFQL